MHYFFGFILIFAIYSAFLFSSFQIPSITYGENSEPVFPVSDMPYNHTFSYWVDKWFDWFLSLPNIPGNTSLSHPRDNYTPEKCSWNQDNKSPVWMLPDGPDQNDLSTTQIRDCKVPAGKALLVQIVGSNCSPNEGYKNDQDLLNCANWILDKAQFSVNIDGKEVMNTYKNPTDRNKIFVKPFTTIITYGKNNYYGDPPGTVRGMEAGYFLFVKPLSLGKHFVNYQESDINTLDSTGNDKRISNVQYNIFVENNTKIVR